MASRKPRISLCSLFIALLACGPQSPGQTATTDTPGTTTTTSTTTTGPATTTSSTTSTDATTATTSAASSDTPTGPATTTGSADTQDFVMRPDLPPSVACDPWNDTCPRGQKCKPNNKDGWQTLCADIDESPAGVGEACESNELNASDDCPDGTMCWGFQRGQDSLRCTPFCVGTPEDSSCADVCSGCLKYEDKLFGVCPVRCNPLADDCPAELGCTTYVFEPRFFCYPPSQEDLGAGEPCVSPFSCESGTACLPANMLPTCAGDSCCTPVCDLTKPDPCAAAYPGTVCAAWPTVNPDFHAECLPLELGLCMAAP
jgi:hypothetical protein